MPQLSLKPILAVALLCALAACGHGNGAATATASAAATAAPATSAPIKVVTTISTLDSFVQAVGGSHVTVQSLVPVGASPETYQPTPQNVAVLAQANILVENGAGLETWLARTIANAGSKSLRIVVGTDGLTIVQNNPHLWMDPQYAKHYVLLIRDALVQFDPAHAADYRANAAHYNLQLDALTASIQRKIDSVPAKNRAMIVFHNAWLYYNARFGIRTLGFIEPSPGQDPNPKNIGKLIDLAKANGLHAIFSEPEYSPKLAQQIARSAGITLVTNLYDDSLGTKPEVSNYISMLNYDTDIIVQAMR